MNDKEFLKWVHDRIVNVYGESPNVDFLIRLREITESKFKEKVVIDESKLIKVEPVMLKRGVI